MNDWIERINKLDLSVYKAILSSTSTGCKRSLLAVQRATAKKHKKYAYLEIGSHLGGTIQPHLVDDRCRRIYSIDPRPSQVMDDRSPGYIAHYDNNSTERMLTMLGSLGYGDLTKIECFELDASEVDPEKIRPRPEIVFIDGEHTKSAVISDFQFCSKVVSENGTIMFHDVKVIYPAILDICSLLDKKHHSHVALRLEGLIFAIFFDSDLVHADPYLSLLQKKNKNFLLKLRVKHWLKQHLPTTFLKLSRKQRNAIRKNAPEQDAAADG
jgi:hypothetical protein